MEDRDPNQSDQKSTNTDEPPGFIIYDEEDVESGIESCSKSLYGKILTQKPIHMNSLQSALSGIWCNPKGLHIEEIVPRTFQFFFDEEDDVKRILVGSPWIFRNSWIILKRWSRIQTIDDIDFSKTTIKAQLWGLPIHCRTPKMGSKIGACLGTVEDVAVFECKEKETPNNPSPTGNEERRYGPWMKANYVGRKIVSKTHDKGGEKSASHSPQAQKSGHYSCDITKLLAALSVSHSKPAKSAPLSPNAPTTILDAPEKHSSPIPINAAHPPSSPSLTRNSHASITLNTHQPPSSPPLARNSHEAITLTSHEPHSSSPLSRNSHATINPSTHQKVPSQMSPVTLSKSIHTSPIKVVAKHTSPNSYSHSHQAHSPMLINPLPRKQSLPSHALPMYINPIHVAPLKSGK
ncbi:hypothetical protein SESBI_25252 [Sesbania bispinosa]|nr:hypothetical protein SESBI_25252 [Sesbania bispinosa]